MANFLLNIVDSSEFSITNIIESSSECAGLFQFDVESIEGISIDVNFGYYAKNKVIVLNGVEASISAASQSVVFSNSLTVRFSVDNSGIPGVFNSAEITLASTTGGPSVSYTGVRQSDAPKCESIQPAFDDLSDTPENKIGSENKYLRVSDDGALIAFDDLKIVDPITVTETNGGMNPQQLIAGSSIEDILRTILEKPIPPTISLSSVSFKEKGIEVDVNIPYTTTDGTAGALVDVTSTNGTVASGEVQYTGMSETFTANATSNYASESATATRTVSFYSPQWYGVSSSASLDYSTYASLNSSGLTKVVQSSSSMDQLFTATNEYVYFISTQSGLIIKDGNLFTNNDWDETPVTVILSNGSSQNMFQYRTQTVKNFINFNYKLV